VTVGILVALVYLFLGVRVLQFKARRADGYADRSLLQDFALFIIVGWPVVVLFSAAAYLTQREFPKS
jgi:hypothetical protein